MKTCAVICEFNPFHYGHAYILEQARSVSGCDTILGLMSGNFVQRGIPTVINSYARAECAILNGADIILELPAVYATASSDVFAHGAVSILNTISSVDSIAMGVEDDTPDTLLLIAQIQAEESPLFKSTLRSQLDNGLNFARAYTYATAFVATHYGQKFETVFDMLHKPNNILASAYAKALIKTNSKIKFLPIKRAGGDITDNMKGKFSSASAIRNNLNNPSIKDAMPNSSYNIMQNILSTSPVSQNEYECLLLYALRIALAKDIADTPECAEGLEHKIKKFARSATSYSEFINDIGKSRFTRGRINRICLHNLLGIKKEMQHDGYIFSRLLGVKNEALNALSILPNSVIKSKRDECNIPVHFLAHYNIDKLSYSIYSLITHSNSADFYRKLLII